MKWRNYKWQNISPQDRKLSRGVVFGIKAIVLCRERRLDFDCLPSY